MTTTRTFVERCNCVRRSRRRRIAGFSAWSTGYQGALCLTIKCRSTTCDEEGQNENVVDLLETASCCHFRFWTCLPRRHSTHGVDDIAERLPAEPACYEGERKSFHAVKVEEESSVRTTRRRANKARKSC